MADPFEPPASPSGLEPAAPHDPAHTRSGAQLEPALGGFFEALLDARQSRAQIQRVQAMIRLGNAGDRRALPALLLALGDSDWIVRKYAVSGLGALAAPEARDPVADMLADPKSEVRRAAARAFKRLDDGDHETVWLQALADPDWLVREAAIEGLARYETPSATDALLAALNDTVWLNRFQALKALDGRPDPRVVGALLNALRTDRELAPWAAPALARHGVDVLDPLIALLADAPPWRQLAIADALGRLDDDRARAALAGMVGHPDAEIESAIRHHGPAMRDFLVQALSGEDWMVRWHAAKLLGRLGDPTATPALMPRVDDVRPEVRLAALEALRQLADPAGEPALAACLHDASWHMRMGAVEALGALDTPSALARLVDALADPRSEVRLAARRALQAKGTRAEAALRDGLLRRPDAYDEMAWLLKTLKTPPPPPQETTP
jgi:HEAT repeat protein